MSHYILLLSSNITKVGELNDFIKMAAVFDVKTSHLEQICIYTYYYTHQIFSDSEFNYLFLNDSHFGFFFFLIC